MFVGEHTFLVKLRFWLDQRRPKIEPICVCVLLNYVQKASVQLIGTTWKQMKLMFGRLCPNCHAFVIIFN